MSLTAHHSLLEALLNEHDVAKLLNVSVATIKAPAPPPRPPPPPVIFPARGVGGDERLADPSTGVAGRFQDRE